MIDEVSLVSARMFNVIDNKLTLNMFIMIFLVILIWVIVTSEFYQAHIIKNNWIFQSVNDYINAFAPIVCANIYISLWATWSHVAIIYFKMQPLHIICVATLTTYDIDFINTNCYLIPLEDLSTLYL